MEASDHDLLQQFAAKRSEDAFRQLVDRHVGMVFSVAHRVTGDAQLAEEIAQTTFATLARKAGTLGHQEALAGWLYHTARHLALRAIRAEQRRRQREQIAAAMNINEPGPNVVAEHLESAMDQLKPEDRDALVLRFFEDRSMREVGLELGLSEDAARMRVNRALEKLRGIFGKLGIAGSAAWLVATLPASTSAAVPVGLGATITTAVLSGTAIAATAAVVTQTTSSTMNLLNLKLAAAVVAAAALTGTSTYLVKERQADRLRADYETLNESRTKLANDQKQAAAAIQLRDEQIEQLRKETSELPRLRGEVDGLNRKLVEMVAVRNENDRLKAELQKAIQSTSRAVSFKAVEPGKLITKQNLTFAGYATPEAALQSVNWAMLYGNYDQVTEGLSPDLLASELKNPKERESFPEKQSKMAPMFQSMQIVARKTIAPNQVELKFRLNYSPEMSSLRPGIKLSSFRVQPMTNVDGSWKLGGSTRDYQAAWDNGGQIEEFNTEN